MNSVYVPYQGAELHVTTWGDASKPAVLMWHGLARTGRDFDEAAQALAADYFVICPDTLGRGLSSWARDITTEYSYAAYQAHALAILAHFNVETLRYVGTSMGGVLGIWLASGPLKDRITQLVVNDIGPELPKAAVGRIIDYVGNPPEFETINGLEGWLRTAYAPFGDNTDRFWRRMADTSARRTDAGRVTVHYDPKIVAQFSHHPGDYNCWDRWEGITCPTLLIRGVDSDLLPAALADRMITCNEHARLTTYAGFGHAPTLASTDAIADLKAFLA